MSKQQSEILSRFDPGQHGPAARKRAMAAATVLVRFATEDGRIPAGHLQEATKRASLATDRCWCPARCRTLADMMRLTAPSRL